MHKCATSKICVYYSPHVKKLWVSSYFLFAHPVVNLFSIPVEKLQIHALLILLPTNLPEIQ